MLLWAAAAAAPLSARAQTGAPAKPPTSGTQVPSEAMPRKELAPAPEVVNPDGDPNRVIEVRVEGVRRADPDAIRNALVTKVGEIFDPAKTAEDLKAVWALNSFADIQLLVQRTPKGIVYVVRVQERPTIREVKLEGNKEVSNDDLKEITETIKPFSILNLAEVQAAAKKIQDKYIEKGFFLAEVTHRIDPIPDSTQVNVVFVIRERAKVTVRQIQLLGAKRVPAAELKELMATREGTLLSFLTGEGTFRQELLERDQMMLQAAYYDRGFINVKVEKPVLAMSADKREIYITIQIEEGEQYRIGKLDVSGDLELPREQLLALMRTRPGETFNRSRLSADIGALNDVYADRGYAYANINPVTAVNAEDRTVDLTFDIQKGKPVSIERIDVSGNTKTRDKVIRREMRVYEGELFNGSGLRRSKDRVTALGYFETVEVTHKPGSDDSKVVVQVDVKEKPTGTFQVGFGFSNVEDFIFTAQVAQNNFFGWGQSVSASAQVSGLRSIFQLDFFDPYFLDTNYIFSVNLFQNSIDRFTYIRNSLGGSLTTGYHVLEDVMVNLTYAYERVNVETSRDQFVYPPDLFRSGTTSSLRLSGTWDRRDNRLFPTAGHMQFASVEVAPPFLGGSLLFSRYTAFSRFYFPLPLGFVFKTQATVGYVQPLTNQRLPISELYQLGGINSVRGYQLATICPSIQLANQLNPDAVTSFACVGGNKQLYVNLELEIPVLPAAGVRAVLFYDAGNAFAEGDRFFEDPINKPPLGLLHAVGFGFRWFSPVGPLRFEWGIPLTRRPGDQPTVFEFNIGNSF